MSITKSFLIALAAAVFLWLMLSPPASAQSDLALEIIRYVNELRAASGLEPYQIDESLMASAQAHSEYQASMMVGSHSQHVDGIGENIAGAYLGKVTPYDVVYNSWADPVHMKTMIGHPTGYIGVGAAINGNTAFYTMRVRWGTGAAVSVTQESGVQRSATAPPQITPLAASTALADGSLFHVVGYGQTLWTIAQAYGIQPDEIRKLNNIAFNADSIYAGQKLVVRKPGAVTAVAAEARMAESAPTVTAVPEAANSVLQPASPAAEQGGTAAPVLPDGPSAGPGDGSKYAFLLAPGLALSFGGGVLLIVGLLIFLSRQT